jgi:hypothetical protein
MQQPTDHDYANAERTGEHVASSGREALVDAQPPARSQAALVRESLVRCPGGPAPGAQ